MEVIYYFVIVRFFEIGYSFGAIIPVTADKNNSIRRICSNSSDAFFYYSVIFKNPIMSVILAVLPVVAAAVIAYNAYVFNAAKFGFFVVLFYLLVVGLVVFRAENSMKKIQRSSPETLRLTKTVYSFKTNAIFYTKNGATIKVPYKNFLKIGKTKMRYFLYFAGQKAMVIRTENVQEVMPVEEFDKFIKSKVKEL